MRRLLGALIGVVMGTVVTLDAAEAARRAGGGRNLGVQRAAPVQKQVQPPAQQSQAAQPAAPAAQAPAAQGNRWLAPLAGIAAGLGLGWLLTQGGFGQLLGGLLLALLAAAVLFAALRLLARRREETVRPLQYAGLGNETVAAPPPSQMPMADSAPPQHRIPAGFNVDGFLKQAKLNFIRVQQANDRSDLATLREIVTDELYESLQAEIAARAGAAQQTEVLELYASLLEVVTEGDMHWASVRFSGGIREVPTAAPEQFDEVWNLQKPVSGKTGWLLAGIQQVS